MRRLKHAEKAFPLLRKTGYEKTSDADRRYNCIAWAFGDQRRRWWPDQMRTNYWPPTLRREESIDAFTRAFELEGYSVTDNSDLEIGYEKVAIYALNGSPKHAARQLESGRWSSKLGPYEDIEHAIDGLNGDVYGQPIRFMRRQRSILLLPPS